MSNPFHPRSIPEYFLSSPLAALLYPLHHLLLRLRGPPRLPPPDAHPIRIVCISDTHSLEPDDIPYGDLLIHAGDLTNDGSIREIQSAVNWLLTLPHPQKVVICGNHDSYFDIRSRRDEDREGFSTTSISNSNTNTTSTSYTNTETETVSASSASIRSLDDLDGQARIDWGDIHYLQHSSVTLSFPPPSSSPSSTSPSSSLISPLQTTPQRTRTLTLYGAPQIPSIIPLPSSHAFTYPPHHNAWSRTIPPTTDILITHTPPQSHLDLSPVYSTGCPFLLSELWRIRPALHVFGHVHAGYGQEPIYWDEAQAAWERLCTSRRSRSKDGALGLLTGWIKDLVDVSGWVDAGRVLVYGVLGVVWAKVWGGAEVGAGWLVNAACMVEGRRGEGTLGNKPQVIVL